MKNMIVVKLFLHVFQEQGRETTNHMTEWAVTPVFILLKLLTSKLQPKKSLINRISSSKSSNRRLHLPFHVFNNLTGHLWLVKSFWCHSHSKCLLLSTFGSCSHKPTPEHTILYPSAWKRLAALPHAHSPTKPQCHYINNAFD